MTGLKLLLINPNTSVHVTERLEASARKGLSAGDSITAVTGRDGPQVVRNAEQLVDAETSALSLADEHLTHHDALVLGISLDGAAARLRQLYPTVPIVGMTEAALFMACLTAERVGLLTLGASLLPLYRQRVEQVGVMSRVVGFEAPEFPAAFSPEGPIVAPAVLDELAQAGERLRRSEAQAIVLAGAVLCGYAERLAERCNMPVFDGVTCAVRLCQALLALNQSN